MVARGASASSGDAGGHARDPREPAEEWHGHGRRAAEPLVASWDPLVDRRARAGRGRRRTLRPTRVLLTYALPLLVALTVVAALDLRRPGAPSTNAIGGAVEQQGSMGANALPTVIGEAPAGKVEVNIPSADLPLGGTYTQMGSAQWHVLPGTTDPYGGGAKSFTYTVEVEDGIDASSFGGEDVLANMVDRTLQDPRSWIGGGELTLRRINSGQPDFRISLTTPGTVRRADICGYQIKYESSCYRPGIRRVIINLARWTRGAVSYQGDTGRYRQYAINHEVGHFFNQTHKGCPNDGDLAPVMMQQSFGVNNDYVWELNQSDSVNKNAVAHDGKTCRPNEWPYPLAKPR